MAPGLPDRATTARITARASSCSRLRPREHLARRAGVLQLPAGRGDLPRWRVQVSFDGGGGRGDGAGRIRRVRHVRLARGRDGAGLHRGARHRRLPERRRRPLRQARPVLRAGPDHRGLLQPRDGRAQSRSEAARALAPGFLAQRLPLELRRGPELPRRGSNLQPRSLRRPRGVLRLLHRQGALQGRRLLRAHGRRVRARRPLLRRPGPCAPNHICGGTPCLDAGAACDDGAQCCTGQCVSGACLATTCNPAGFECQTTDNCCSGLTCNPTGACAVPVACNEAGAVCLHASDCCQAKDAQLFCFQPGGDGAGVWPHLRRGLAHQRGVLHRRRLLRRAALQSGHPHVRGAVLAARRRVRGGRSLFQPQLCVQRRGAGLPAALLHRRLLRQGQQLLLGALPRRRHVRGEVQRHLRSRRVRHGGPLDGTCATMPAIHAACAAAVCAVDTYCCCQAWDRDLHRPGDRRLSIPPRPPARTPATDPRSRRRPALNHTPFPDQSLRSAPRRSPPSSPQAACS